ncbi:HNH endonuclease [Curvibacter sp. PAE-UM]|uniref:HNH endonuclease n=1 Tax=Curvibacter sp. PAE-UM TaxID=1714344 RepID=UPI0012E3F018|nr:HNH endonuclease [Curvibacter sp. PAE-UM]
MSRTNDLLYIETEDSCANCGIRDVRALTIHHIEQVKPKNEAYDNKIVLCHNCHQCHHDGTGPSDKQLRDIKRRLIVKTLTRLGLNALKRANRHSMVAASPFTVDHLVEWGYLKHVEDLSSWGDESGEEFPLESIYKITDRGRELLQKWKLT